MYNLTMRLHSYLFESYTVDRKTTGEITGAAFLVFTVMVYKPRKKTKNIMLLSQLHLCILIRKHSSTREKTKSKAIFIWSALKREK